MPGLSVDIGTGIGITFGTSGFAGEIIAVRRSGIARPSIPVPHMGTAKPSGDAYGNTPKIPGRIVDGGQLEIDVHHDPREKPAIHADPETITLTYPLVPGDTTPATEAFSGFITSVDRELPLEDKMVSTITVEVSGEVTPVDAT